MALCLSIRLRMDRCLVDFELTKQLLLSANKPTLSTLLLRRGIGGAVLFGLAE